jgi:hypothetical protein
VYIRDTLQRESVTVMECISAADFAIGPMINMPGKIFQHKHFDNNLPGGTKLAVSENGHTDDELAYSWLWHFDQQT